MSSILLFDDINAERKDARVCLEQLIARGDLPKSEILEAATKEQAMQLFSEREDIYLGVLDIVHGAATDGLEVARDIQKQREIPIALITGSYSGSDFTTLKEWVMEGNGRNTAVSLCAKLGFGPMSLEDYTNALGMTIGEAMSKLGRGNDAQFYDKVIARMQGRTDLSLYKALSVFFKQIRARLNVELEKVTDADFKEKARNAPWLFDESKEDIALIHNMRKPVAVYEMCDAFSRMQGETLSEKYPKIFKQIELMESIIDYVVEAKNEFSPLPNHLREHRAELNDAKRKPFPNVGYAKLENRERMLKDKNVPYFVVKPGENLSDYKAKLDEVRQVTGQVIARSMGLEDSLGFPMAGMYDSVPGIDGFGKLVLAVGEIRDMNSPKLADFLLGRVLEKPVGTMNVMVEPYYPTEYLGIALQHHNFPTIFLIEYYKRGTVKEDRLNSALVYDAEQKRVLADNSALGIDTKILAETVYKAFLHSREVCRTQKDVAAQMEFAFDDASSINILQLRNSKKIDNLEGSVSEEYLLFGHNPGEEMVVIYPEKVHQVSLVSKRAKEKGYRLCMVLKSESIAHLAAIPDNLGLVIAGRGLAIQNHDLFNALVNSDCFLSLPKDRAIENLNLFQGQRISYSSDGTSYQITPIDSTSEIIQGVKKIINS